MRFKNLDLNLLVALDALLDTEGVSAAAKRLNLTQPAVSAALGRLRDYFGDDLLVLDGKRMHPTPFAIDLLPQLKQCLLEISAMVDRPVGFEPATAERNFSIAAPDFMIPAVVAPLVAKVGREAPGVKIKILMATNETPGHLNDGKVDLLLLAEQYLHPNQPAEFLYEERHVVVGCRSNPLFAGTLTEDKVFARGHISVVSGPAQLPSVADRQLAVAGRVSRIELVAPSFTVLPWLLRDTPRLAFMQERLARAIATAFPIAFAPVPFELPIIREMVQYHRARAADAGLLWLRRQLAEVVSAAA